MILQLSLPKGKLSFCSLSMVITDEGYAAAGDDDDTV
jgi:hypothetical protein